MLGSVTPPGRLRRALSEALGRAQAGGAVEVELIDLADRRIAFADGRPLDALNDDTEAVVATLAGADVVVLATPVYRGSMTGALKNLLDQVPVTALRDKPVAIVAMGGSDHHFLGVERHLRDVLAFFGTHTLPNAAYLSGRDFSDAAPTERAEHELDVLLTATIVLAGAVADLASLGPAPLGARFQ